MKFVLISVEMESLGSSSTAAAINASKLKLLLASFAAFSLHISTGAVLSWPSPMIPRLNLTNSENSLLSSLFSLGAAPGPIIFAFCFDTIGRKGALFVISAMYFLSWILLLISHNIVAIYFSRLIGGIGIGGVFAGVSLYVAEICDEKLRGPLGTLPHTFLAVGYLVEYCVGPFVSYTILAGVSLSTTVLFIVCFSFVPESPHYLIAKGKTNEAYSSLLWLRGNTPDEDIKREISEIQDAIKQESQNKTGFQKLLTSRAVHKGLAICFLLLMIQQGSGVNAILAYVQFIFEHSQLYLHPSLVPILIGVTNLFASIPAPFLVRLYGYKMVFAVTTIGVGASYFLLGTYFYLLDNKYDVASLGFLPVAAVILFNVFFCTGCGSLAWGYAAMIFSPSVKGMALGIGGVFSGLFGFLVVQVFSTILLTYGFTAVFFGFGIYLVLGGIAVWLLVPDVSKMSFQEIQDLMEDVEINNYRKDVG